MVGVVKVGAHSQMVGVCQEEIWGLDDASVEEGKIQEGVLVETWVGEHSYRVEEYLGTHLGASLEGAYQGVAHCSREEEPP